MSEDTAGQFSPIFVFQGLQEAVTDARGLTQLVQGDFTEFPLALQVFTKFSLGHRNDLPLYEVRVAHCASGAQPLTDYRRGEKVLSNE